MWDSNTIERGASREIDPKTNVANALRPQKATSDREDASLREAWVGMERAR
jgi:hypothetical protein